MVYVLIATVNVNVGVRVCAFFLEMGKIITVLAMKRLWLLRSLCDCLCMCMSVCVFVYVSTCTFNGCAIGLQFTGRESSRPQLAPHSSRP